MGNHQGHSCHFLDIHLLLNAAAFQHQDSMMSDVPFLPSHDRKTPIKLLAFMCFPEPHRRILALAAFAAETMNVGELRARLAAEINEESRQALVFLKPYLGSGEIDAAKIEDAGPLRERIKEVLEIVEDFRSGVYEPSGARRGLVNAPPLVDLKKQVSRAMEGGATSAGMQIIHVARMHFYPRLGLKSSLTRARSLLEQTTWEAGTFGSERHQINALNKWEPVAPLWAGVMLAGGYPWGKRDTNFRHMEFIDGFFSVLENPNLIALALSYAQFLADFGVSFYPFKSQTPLLQRNNLNSFATDVDACRPPLQALSLTEQKAAEKARTKKDRVDLA